MMSTWRHRSKTPPWAPALALAMLTAVSMARADGTASAVNCPDGLAVVTGSKAPDLPDICAGVASALKFLAPHGVRPSEPVAIQVTTHIPPEAGRTAAGCYIEQRRQVYMVPYDRFRQARTWFGVPIDRRLYRALAAHETAHAAAACSFRIPNPTIQAKEYLAYVTMFSVMPAELRRQALARVKTQGFESLDRFTPLLYSFDPMRFGAEAYRHFSATNNPTALIQAVLAGEVLLD